ncbi:MAG: sodium:solute symporter family protein [Planctomycetota bacterium]|jgi:SSS family solute:Na+ symporter
MTHALDIAVMVLYFVGITAFGALFGRFTKSTKDFFMAGQRFPAWLIAVSCIATLVGSYSFVKYASAGFKYGIASSQTYLNDWFWMPLWMFGWLPILYFAGIVTVPEYFTRRFNSRVRVAATVVLLFYLLGYIGINLYTIGTALQGLFQLDTGYILVFAVVMAAMCMAYEFTGGQTSVIFTDLLQGILLLVAGLLLFFLGIAWLGGFDSFWQLLPTGHGRALPPFNADPKFNFVGIFWQDGLAGGLAFYFMNQGMLLRFLSARSAATARRAAGWVILLLMPITAIAVSGAGWVAAAIHETGDELQGTDPEHVFIAVSDLLCGPGVFGLVIAALLAALMSTTDTLINASSSVLVNDIYRPLQPGQDERHYLKVARWASLLAAVIGVLLVPLYMVHGSIYEAHGFFMALITPPMAVALLLAFLWPRYNAAGAMATLVGGIVLQFLSWPFQDLVAPFSHGVERIYDEAGVEQVSYKYIRACFGMAVSLGLGVVATLVTAKPDAAGIRGLTLWTCRQRASSRLPAGRRPSKVRTTIRDAGDLPVAANAPTDLPLAPALRDALAVRDGDLVFVDDARWWLGGLRSARCRVVADQAKPGHGIALPTQVLKKNRWQADQKVVLTRIE